MMKDLAARMLACSGQHNDRDNVARTVLADAIALVEKVEGDWCHASREMFSTHVNKAERALNRHGRVFFSLLSRVLAVVPVVVVNAVFPDIAAGLPWQHLLMANMGLRMIVDETVGSGFYDRDRGRGNAWECDYAGSLAFARDRCEMLIDLTDPQ